MRAGSVLSKNEHPWFAEEQMIQPTSQVGGNGALMESPNGRAEFTTKLALRGYCSGCCSLSQQSEA